MIRSIEGRRLIPSFSPSYDCLLPFTSREYRFAQAGGRPLLVNPVALSILNCPETYTNCLTSLRILVQRQFSVYFHRLFASRARWAILLPPADRQGDLFVMFINFAQSGQS